MPDPNLIYQVHLYQTLQARLKDRFPDLDDETRRRDDARHPRGCTSFQESIAAIARSALIDQALHEGVKARLDEMKQRLSRLDKRIVKKRELALEAMLEVGLTNWKSPTSRFQPGWGLQPSPSSPRKKFRIPTGSLSHQSSIATVYSAI
jgi:hypothetical protein